MSAVTEARGIRRIDPAWSAPGSDYVTALVWSPDGARLAAAYADGAIRIVSGVDGTLLHVLPGHGHGTLALAWSPDGRWLASGGQDGLARLWEGSSGMEVAALNGGSAWVEHLAWSRKGPRLATAAGRSLRVWSAQGQSLFNFAAHASTISGLAWMRDSRHLATACYGGVNLWRLGQSAPERCFEWKGSFLSLAVSPNERQIAGGCQDAAMLVWNAKTGKSVVMQGYPGKVVRLDWDADSRFLASAAANQVVLWNFSGAGPADQEPLVLHRHVDRIVDLRFHPKTGFLASVGDEGMLIVWRLPNGLISHVGIVAHPLSVLVWHPRGRALAVGSSSGSIDLFRVDGVA